MWLQNPVFCDFRVAPNLDLPGAGVWSDAGSQRLDESRALARAEGGRSHDWFISPNGVCFELRRRARKAAIVSVPVPGLA